MLLVNITSKTIEDETVKAVEVVDDATGKIVPISLSYPSTWTDAEIDADVRGIIGSRGYEV